MTANQRKLGWERPVALQGVQVRVADAREQHLQPPQKVNVHAKETESVFMIRDSSSTAETSASQQPLTHPNKHFSSVQLGWLDVVQLLDRDLVRPTVFIKNGYAVGWRHLELRLARILHHLSTCPASSFVDERFVIL